MHQLCGDKVVSKIHRYHKTQTTFEGDSINKTKTKAEGNYIVQYKYKKCGQI